LKFLGEFGSSDPAGGAEDDVGVANASFEEALGPTEFNA